MMKRSVKYGVIVLASIAALSACAKKETVRQANTVQVQQPGDELRSCDALVNEMNSINQAVKSREADSAWTAENLVSGKAGFRVGGGMGIVDLSQASSEEIQAYQQRYEYLDLVARRKGCYI